LKHVNCLNVKIILINIFPSSIKMSFLWKGNLQTDNSLQNTCKDCIDKNKRIANYELFFNETQDILKKKDEDLLDAQTRLLEQQKRLDEFEITTQAQIAFREKLIEQYEQCKQIYGEEKKHWLEDRKMWRDEKSKWESKTMDLENEKSNLEDKLEHFNDDKMIWKQHQKVLEDKIQILSKEIEEWELKHSEFSKLFDIQDQNFKDKEEKIIQNYHEKIEEWIDEYDEKEAEWKSKEAEYEYSILQYQDNENEYEMKIQDMKYDVEERLESCEREMERKYKMIQEEYAMEKDAYWEKRILELNAKYDEEFIEFRDNLKQREIKLNLEKDELESLLKEEIERLKEENINLETEKKELEKKRIDLSLENRGLTADNQWLEREWKDGQSEIQRIKQENDNLKMEKGKLSEQNEKLAVQQKKIEGDYEKLKSESKKNFEHVETQTLEEIEKKIKNNTFDPNMDLVDYVQDESGMRRRNIKKKKKRIESQTDGAISFVPPSVELMYKNDYQKKIESNHGYEYHMYHPNIFPDNHVIDISSDGEDKQPAYDTNNFFLRIAGLVKSMSSQNEQSRILELEQQIQNFEKQMEEYKSQVIKLSENNRMLQNKIQKYECNSIIELNRKIRSGIPVHFFPYHSNHQILNTSHIHSVDLDLH